MAGRGIAFCPFEQSLRADALHERDQLPDLLVGHSHWSHFTSRHAVANGAVQLHILATAAVNARREVGAAAPFAGRSVAIRAVSLKEGPALLNVGVRRE